MDYPLQWKAQIQIQLTIYNIFAMILSIIIPIYNVEPYIKKCLLSCICQKDVSNREYEIILVNDGTKDNSMEIVKEIMDSHPDSVPVKIINQKNMGLSAARNTGIENSQGEYIWFVDSDDWIDEDSVKCIIDKLKDGCVDILQMPYKLIYENNRPDEIERVKNIETPISGCECMKITRFPNLAQSRIYRRLFLTDNNILFTRGILHEDAEFKPRAIWQAKSIKTFNKPCYNYLKRSTGSITASFTMRNAEGRWFGVKSMYLFSKDFSFKDQLLFNPDMNFNMYFVLTGLKKLNKSDKKLIIEEITKHHKIFKRMIWTLSPKKFLVYLMLYLNPKFFLSLYSK